MSKQINRFVLPALVMPSKRRTSLCNDCDDRGGFGVKDGADL